MAAWNARFVAKYSFELATSRQVVCEAEGVILA
jgi:hypothetical protein